MNTKMTKLLALLLAMVMVLGLFAGCAKTEDTSTDTTDTTDTTTDTTDTTEEEADTTLVYATATFGQKFSPFFATTAYDQDLVSLVSGAILSSDREGNIVRNGIEGETIPYNGTDYTYYGMGDVEVVENADGTVDYNLTMRDDIKFSDGTPADIDDVIFGIYVMADPTYDGASTIYALPIEGMSEYYNSLAQLSTLLVQAGKDNTDFTNWDEETQTQFWADVETAGEAFAQEIVDYCMANGLGTTVAECAANWGYPDLPADATALDFWHAIEAAYEGDIIAASDTETAGSSLFDFIDGYDEKYGQWITMGDSVDYIPGIIRTGDYSMTIHMTSYDATAIYNMGFYIAPLHYYGDEASYNYDEHKFGFPKGDLSIVREKTTQPLGCGPYVFEGYNNGVATLTANPYYFQGEPATKTLLMQEADDADFIPGVVTGSFDIAVPSLNDDAVAALACPARTVWRMRIP